MDEQATPAPEPVTTPVVSADATTGQATPDPATPPAGEASTAIPAPDSVVADIPAIEPPQGEEAVQALTEPVSAPETPVVSSETTTGQAPQTEPVPEQTQTTAEIPTPQMEGNEVLPEVKSEPVSPSIGVSSEVPRAEAPTVPEFQPSQPEPVATPPTETRPTTSEQQPQTQQGTSQPEPVPTSAPASSAPAQAPTTPSQSRNLITLLLKKAQLTIQLRKQKKLLKVMALFAKKSHITNSDVAKLLHVSNATALRYLTQLEKENKISQIGKTGHAVTYTKR